ncbi:methyltransferase domain-containing protein [Rufibacter hautae]|uniref:Methyltransferase domain-containing protein n=1 Tax=Rufibacter hautae TaxID=2595005 RepID=A0A5B6TEH2_9BACT|nr:methyltransferase domain-containing protein [Rufibacter hautae]KAA3437582.1 methyltransferase domain-containing protein [Rufibacter hautae]
MKKKFNQHLKQRGVIGTAKRFKQCLDENGLDYTVKQIFKPIDKNQNGIVVEQHSTLEETKIVVESNTPQRIVPRPTALRKYPFNALDTILELRLPECKGVFIQAPVIDWEVPLFQRPQHMSIAMADAGYLVFYISSNVYDIVDGFIEVYPNLFVTNRTDLPFILEGAYVSVYSTSSAYTTANLSDIRKKNKIIYEYIDHIDPQISGMATETLEKQFNYFNDETVDIVAISGRALIEDFKGKVSDDKIVYVPNGVEFEHYQSLIQYNEVLPALLEPIVAKQKPIVGYFGALAPWLWYDLIDKVTLNMPEYEFIFIGPDYYGGVERLPTRENVHYLGTIDYKTLPHYAKYFDVAIIPFSPGQIAKTTSPLKLFEYFALQKPVVVTSEMQECVAFKEVLSGDSAENFIRQINNAYLLSKDQQFKKDLLARALENSWKMRAKALSKRILQEGPSFAKTTLPLKELVGGVNNRLIVHVVNGIDSTYLESRAFKVAQRLIKSKYTYVFYDVSPDARLGEYVLGEGIYLASSIETIISVNKNFTYIIDKNGVDSIENGISDVKINKGLVVFQYEGESLLNANSLVNRLISDELNIVITISRQATEIVKTVRNYNYCEIIERHNDANISALKLKAIIEFNHYDYTSAQLEEVQNEILDIYRKDDPTIVSYYELAYKEAEKNYWYPVLDWIDSLGEVKSAIDIGAAYGTLLLYAMKRYPINKSVVIDPVGYMSKTYIERYNIGFYTKDIEKDNFSDLGKFDLVLFTEVLEHLNFYPVSTLLKIKSLLSPKGKLIISTPDSQEWGITTKYYNSLEEVPVFNNQVQPWIDDHIWQYSFDEFIKVIGEAGFEVLDVGFSKGGIARHTCLLLQAK